MLENVVFDMHTREVDYLHTSVKENTRATYPIEYIPNAKTPCVGPHPKNVILLACDAFGVFPPLSKLNLALALTMYHFISGYLALIQTHNIIQFCTYGFIFPKQVAAKQIEIVCIFRRGEEATKTANRLGFKMKGIQVSF